MPWATSYWLPAEKWLPPYWPPYSWQIRDSSYPMQLAPIPEGFVAPWWLYPKDQWPYEDIPWGDKVFGAFSARKVMMAEDLKNHPPFGYVKFNTPTQPSLNALTPIKAHMRPPVWLDISPHPSVWAEGKLISAMREMSRKRPLKLITNEGSITIRSIRHPNWSQYKNVLSERSAAIKAKREAEHRELLAEEMVKTKGQPQPSKDLFS
jgi:hypothetical protein